MTQTQSQTQSQSNGGRFALAGRAAVVTGVVSGMGAGVARSLAQAGARVLLLDRDAAGCGKFAGELVTRRLC